MGTRGRSQKKERQEQRKKKKQKEKAKAKKDEEKKIQDEEERKKVTRELLTSYGLENLLEKEVSKETKKTNTQSVSISPMLHLFIVYRKGHMYDKLFAF